MGKKANEKRREIFAKLEQEGRLRPLYKKRERKKPPVVIVETTGCYCRDKYSDNLPMLWRPCPDCPLDTAAQGV